MQSTEMEGKTVLITGATAGIGRVAARELADRGAKIVFIARSRDKAEATSGWISEQTGNEAVSYLIADFSSLAQVRAVAEEFRSKHRELHVLLNNAGAIFLSRSESEDGIEMTLAVNHLAPFLLTNLLLELVKASAPARIVNVSSHAHVSARMDFEDLECRKSYGLMRAYAQSKLANILFTYELAGRLAGSGITANALHPGFVASQFAKNNGFVARALMPLAQLLGRAVDVEKGARTSVYLASSPEVEGVSGRYFVASKETSSSEASHDRASMIKLWEISSRMTGLPVSV